MKRRNDNEEIESDSDYEVENGVNDEDEEQYETAHQTNVRLKKEKVKKIKEELKKRKVDNIDDEVRKTLEEEALEKQGKLMKDISKDCLRPDMPNMSLHKFKHDITCFTYSIDGKFVFSGSRTGDLIKWDVETGLSLVLVKGGKRINKHEFHCTRITAIAACDEYLATGDLEKKVFIWNISDLSLKKVLIKHRKPITGLVFRKHTQQLFSSDKNGIIFVWDMVLMDAFEELMGHTGEITAIDSNLSNNCVTCSGIGDLTVKLWKDNSSVITYTVPKGHFELSFECITMINEKFFIAGSLSNKLYLWDSISKKSAICVVSPAHGIPTNPELVVCTDIFVSSVCALKQSTVFASGSNMSEVKIWNLILGASGELAINLLFLLPNILGSVNDLRFSPNRKDLAVGTCDQHKSTRMQKRTPNAKSAVNIFKLFK